MTRYLKTLVALVVALMAAVGGSRDAESEQYGALVLGMYGLEDTSATAWAFDFGDSAAAAEDAAARRCEEQLGNLCR